MGLVESTPAPEAEVACSALQDENSKRRVDYIHRLGIHRDGRCAIHVPNTHLESPGSIKERPRTRRCRSRCSSVDSKIRSASEASTRAESEESADSNFEMSDLSSQEDAESVSGAASETALKCLDTSGQEDFRVGFLRKLSYQKVWVPKPQRGPSHQTVIIFDWDDTLLCTSYLTTHLAQYWSIPPTVEKQLQLIADASQKLLETAMRLGNTFIITNAAPMWVQYSAAKYVPSLLRTLESVPVISARGRHEAQFPHDVGEWKRHAFLDVQRQLDSQIITNIVSLGDSNWEMAATHAMSKEFDTALVKTVKFHENPCPEALLKQLELVVPKFERIIMNARNMKIALEPRNAEP